MFLSFLRVQKSPASRSISSLCTRLFTSQPAPTSASYDDLVNTAGRERDFHALRNLLNKRIFDGCFNTSDTFKFVTTEAISSGVLDDVISTLSRLDHGLPRKSACNSLIARLSKLDLMEEPLRVVEVMASQDYGLTASSFHPMLNNLCKRKKMEDAWRVVEIMESYGFPPDITALNYLLTAYCFKGNLKGASQVMRRIEEGGLGADARTYDALVLGACRAGKVEGAIALMRRMVEDRVPVLYSSHTHVINALLGKGWFGQAVRLVLAFAGREKGLDTECFEVLAGKLVKLERREEAKLVLEEMKKRGLVMSDKLRRYYELNVMLSQF